MGRRGKGLRRCRENQRILRSGDGEGEREVEITRDGGWGEQERDKEW